MALAAAALLLAGLLVAALLAGFVVRQRAARAFAGAAGGSTGKRAAAAEPAKAEPRHRATLLFGTQTGTAERFGKQLKGELAGLYAGPDAACELHDVEEYAHEERLPREKLVILLLATYGDGEPTDNAAAFYSWVSRAAGEAERGEGGKLLQGVSFAVFALGNKQYEHFCAVGTHVARALAALGATAICDVGMGDDDEDIEADFDKWRLQLLEAVATSGLLGLPPAAKARGSLEVFAADGVAAYEAELHNGTGAAALAPAAAWTGDGSGARSPFAATVAAKRELHGPASERSCLHVELDFSGAKASYRAGDHVGVLAQNEPEVVERAAAALGLPPSLVFSLRLPPGNPHQLPAPFPGPTSLADALAWHADLLSPVSRPALQALAAFAEGGAGAQLRRLLGPEGAEEYRAWQCHSRSLLEALEEFEGVRPPLGAFFGSIAQRLQPRLYSISSSPLRSPARAHVTCSVVAHPTPTGRPHRGVVSHQLQRCQPGDRLPAFLRRSTFKLPADARVPLILVGPGTGLAPFRGFLQERAELAAGGAELGPAHLFFGCRRRSHDFLYEQELGELQAAGALSRLHTAFSREGAAKVYVQHNMADCAGELWRLLQAGGAVYVCGEAKHMARDVHAALLEIAAPAPGGAEAFLAGLSAAGRYQKDVW